MSANSIYKPQSPVMQWLEARLPIAVWSMPRSRLSGAAQPELLVDVRLHPRVHVGAQIVTGVVLAMHYTPLSISPSTPSNSSCAT